MIRRVLLLALLLPAVGVAQEWSPVFFGRASAESGSVPGSATLEVLTGLEASWGEASAALKPGLALSEGRPRWELPEAWLSWSGGFWSAQVGLWPETPGPALLRSLKPALTVGSGTAFLATAGQDRVPSPAKAMLRFIGGEWSWQGEVGLWRPAPETPWPDSPWFPPKDIPRTFAVAGLEYHLGSVSTSPGEEGSPGTEWPLRSEVRWSALWGDAAVGVYHGPDSQVLIVPGLTNFGSGVGNEFDLLLTPRWNTVWQGWLALEVPVAGGKFWTEQRWTGNRLRTVDGTELVEGDVFTVEPQTGASTVWEGLAGASYSLSVGPAGTLRLWTEASLYRPLGTEAPAPEFTEQWVAGASWEESQGRGRVDVLGGSPWDRSQGWMWTRITWNWMEGRSLWLGSPVFWGKEDSAWGQYRNRRVLALGTTWEQ